MQNFYTRFVREGEGVWLCVAPAELMLPGGRIQVTVGTRFTRGTRYMGVDVAELLDTEHRRLQPRGWSSPTS